MTYRTLLCCLEERSAKEMLKVVLPQLLPEGWAIQFVVFEGKADLLKRLGFRLQHWQGADTSVLVLCDQDAQDCRMLKRNIRSIVETAGYLEASKIRIACHELENFYLGDLSAVEQGLSVKGLVKLSGKMPYRQPDGMTNAPEQLRKITAFRYAKCEGSRAIAPYLDLSGLSKSQSFNALIAAVRELSRGTHAQAENPHDQR